MDINHNQTLEAVAASEDELDLFRSLEVGDSYSYFGLPVTPPTVSRIEEHEEFGRLIVSETEGQEELLYERDGCIWMNTPDPEMADDHENLPYPVENLHRPTETVSN